MVFSFASSGVPSSQSVTSFAELSNNCILPPVVASITVRDARATLKVTSGQEVRFGRLNQVGDKMRAAVAVLGQPGIEERTYIDVSAPSTPVAG